jgi:glutamyl-tRNA reductase
MYFNVFGINYHKAVIEIREKVDFSDSKIIDATSRLLNYENIKEVVILATCNRSELYLLSETPISLDFAQSFYRKFFNLNDAKNYVFLKQDEDALVHLFNTAIGLDSLIIGEDQILGQIKDAYQNALDIGSTGKITNQVFREVINKSKSIKTQSKASDNPTNISYIAIKKLKENMDLRNKKVLLIGVGNMGKLALNYIIEENAEIFISNLRYENSIKIKNEFKNVTIVDYVSYKDLLKEVDVIISATRSPHLIVRNENILNDGRNQYFIDLAMPRDIEESIEKLPYKHLYDVDDLNEDSKNNIEIRKELLEIYEDEITTKSFELNKWIKHIEIEQIYKDIDLRCEEVAEETLNYIYRKTNLTSAEKIKVDRIIRNSLKRVAKDPINKISKLSLNEEDFSKAIEILKDVY